MEFEKLVSPSLKDLFITHIEAMILSGELPVGQQLPPERQLAQSMGVSRAVVNSGVAELERRGFLEVRPRVGIFVTDYRRAGTLDTLKSIMTYNRGRLRNEEIRSILEIRDALDKLAAAGIIACASPGAGRCARPFLPGRRRPSGRPGTTAMRRRRPLPSSMSWPCSRATPCCP